MAAGMTDRNSAVIIHVFEKADEKLRQEIATKADIQNLRETMATKVEMQAMRSELVERIAASEVRVLRWMVGGFLTQTALLVAILAFLR
jgi:hypothetical protein